ncbi:MAG: lysophospholipid acyltransferase family protein [Tissierellia bacterium]|nr:lysophospholipid acyltransferase family protein [Tissierellia bacterium]
MFYRFFRFLILIFFKIVFRLKVIGKEKIPDNSKFILCANHNSNWDPLAIAAAMDNQVYFMAKKELFKTKFTNWFFSKLGAFPVDRENADLKAMKKSLKILKDGHCLGIYPEGTRTNKIDREAMKNGVGFIALKAKSNVVTAEIKDGYKIFRPVKVIIKDNLSIKDYEKLNNKEAVKRLSDDIFNSIYNNQLEGE